MIIKKNKKELKNMRLFFRVSPEDMNKLNLIIKNIPREHELTTKYQDTPGKYFDNWVTLKELFKTPIFIKLKQVPQIKEIEQMVLGGLIS